MQQPGALSNGLVRCPSHGLRLASGSRSVKLPWKPKQNAWYGTWGVELGCQDKRLACWVLWNDWCCHVAPQLSNFLVTTLVFEISLDVELILLGMQFAIFWKTALISSPSPSIGPRKVYIKYPRQMQPIPLARWEWFGTHNSPNSYGFCSRWTARTPQASVTSGSAAAQWSWSLWSFRFFPGGSSSPAVRPKTCGGAAGQMLDQCSGGAADIEVCSYAPLLARLVLKDSKQAVRLKGSLLGFRAPFQQSNRI